MAGAGLTPDRFWALTAQEWSMIVTSLTPMASGLDRAGLEQLLAAERQKGQHRE